MGFVASLVACVQLFAAAPVIQHSDVVGVVAGNTVEYRVIALDGAITYTAQGLPEGTTLNSATGLISGTPTKVGTYPVTVTASNGDGSSSTVITMNVVSTSAAPLIYAPLTFDAFYEGRPGGDMFTCALKATGSPTSYQATDPLPGGWSFASGTIVGRTTTAGLFVVPVTATNANGTGSAAVTIRVHPACTGLRPAAGELHPGDTLRVAVQFSRPVTFSGGSPYLEFHTYPDSGTKRLTYVSGNGTASFEFAYVVGATDTAGDVYLYNSLQPAAGGAVVGLADADGLTLGASLPAGSTDAPIGRIVVAAPATSPAPTAPVAVTSPVSTTATPPVLSTTTPPPAPVATNPAAKPAPVLTPTGNSGAATSAAGSVAATPPTAAPVTPAAPAANVEPVAAAATPTVPAATAVPTVAATGTPAGARLVNLSARAIVRDGDAARSFIAGFVVSGDAPKQLLLRASGPTLTSFGVGAALPNPGLRVFDASGRTVAENDDWSGANVADAANASGAFALKPGSGDAAMLVTLPPGNYSMQVSPNAGSGVALAEIYEVGATSTSAPLINISTRAYVDNGENALTAGFVVTGSASKRLLIRGVGPALGNYGVAGALADPVVKLYRGDAVIAQNDNWETPLASDAGVSASAGSDIAAAAKRVGAFALGAGSHDAALIASLPPGSYTAVVTPGSGTAGAGLIEVYELPAE